MTKVVDIQSKLSETAQLVLTQFTELTGMEANDYVVNDVHRLIAGMPKSLANQKRKYVDELFAEIRANTGTDDDGKDLAEDKQGHAYHAAVRKYERLAPRIMQEAIGFDRLFETCHKEWYESTMDKPWSRTSTKSKSMTKQEKEAREALAKIHKVA